MLRKLIIHIFLLSQLVDSYAQDVHHSQYYAVPQVMGPSFAGSTKGSRISMNFRDQWPGIQRDYKTYTLAFDHNIVDKRIGYGIIYMRDLSGGGALKSNNVVLQFNKGVMIEKKIELRAGFQASYRSMKYSLVNLVFANQLSFDGAFGNTNANVPNLPSEKQIDLGASLLWRHPNVWFGVAVNKIRVPGVAIFQSNFEPGTEINAYGGLKFALTQNYKYKGRDNIYYTSYLRVQGASMQSNMGILLEKRPLIFGVWYRGYPSSGFIKTLKNHDAVILMTGIKSDSFWLSYSYDISLRKILKYTGGAHEITMSIMFNQKESRSKKGKVACPRG